MAKKTSKDKHMVLMSPPNGEKTEYEVGWQIITPAVAQKMLRNLAPQRTLSPQTVNNYADDMKNGRWNCAVSDPIHINADGALSNGRHRCEAIIESDTTIWSWVIHGLRNDSYFEEDTGKLRTMGDILTMNKETNGEKLATTLLYLYRFSQGSIGHTHAGRKYDNKRVMYQFFKKHPSLSSTVNQTIARSNNMPLRICPVSIMSFLVYVFEHIDLKMACSYFQIVFNERAPRLNEECPISLMVKRLQEECTKSERVKRMTSREKMANLIKAWDFYVQNRRVSHVRHLIWRIDENWPDILDNEGNIVNYENINFSVKAV